MLSSGGGGGRSSAMMGKKVVVVVEMVEAVSSSRLVRVVRVIHTMRIRLCTLNKCEATMAVNITIRAIGQSGCVDPLTCRTPHNTHEDVMLSRCGLLFLTCHLAL